MDKETRKYLKARIDEDARQRKHGSLDPEDLELQIIEAEAKGYPEVADAFRRIKDAVNFLLGEGYSVEQVEDAFDRFFSKRK